MLSISKGLLGWSWQHTEGDLLGKQTVTHPSDFLILQYRLDCSLFFEKAVWTMTFSLRHWICNVCNVVFIPLFLTEKHYSLPFFQILSLNIFYWVFYLKTVYSFLISILNGLYLSMIIFANFNLKFNNIYIKLHNRILWWTVASSEFIIHNGSPPPQLTLEESPSNYQHWSSFLLSVLWKKPAGSGVAYT